MKINLKLTNGEIDIRTTFHIKPKKIYTLNLYVNFLKNKCSKTRLIKNNWLMFGRLRNVIDLLLVGTKRQSVYRLSNGLV